MPFLISYSQTRTENGKPGAQKESRNPPAQKKHKNRSRFVLQRPESQWIHGDFKRRPCKAQKCGKRDPSGFFFPMDLRRFPAGRRSWQEPLLYGRIITNPTARGRIRKDVTFLWENSIKQACRTLGRMSRGMGWKKDAILV